MYSSSNPRISRWVASLAWLLAVASPTKLVFTSIAWLKRKLYRLISWSSSSVPAARMAPVWLASLLLLSFVWAEDRTLVKPPKPVASVVSKGTLVGELEFQAGVRRAGTKLVAASVKSL